MPQILPPNDLEKLADSAKDATEFLKAMANENRLMILCSLLNGERSVTELNEHVPLSQSALSQHLAALRKAELVSTRREAQTIYYQVSNAAVLGVLKVLKDTFCPP